jgi:hypothetical protein
MAKSILSLHAKFSVYFLLLNHSNPIHMTAALRPPRRALGYLLVFVGALLLMVVLHQLLVLWSGIATNASTPQRSLVLVVELLAASASTALALRAGMRRIDGK